jgi:hypothetical protein
MNKESIAAMNADYVRVVVRAALEDLESARLAHGADSAAYQRQEERSMGFIRGNLEAVLAAATIELERRGQLGGVAADA